MNKWLTADMETFGVIHGMEIDWGGMFEGDKDWVNTRGEIGWVNSCGEISSGEHHERAYLLMECLWGYVDGMIM